MNSSYRDLQRVLHATTCYTCMNVRLQRPITFGVSSRYMGVFFFANLNDGLMLNAFIWKSAEPSLQPTDCCLKEDLDGYYESGDIQEGQGSRADILKIMDDMTALVPERTLLQKYGPEYLRLKKPLAGSIADAKMDEARSYMRTKFTTARLRPWQKEAWNVLSKTGDREVLFIIDEYGNTGKTWFAQWLVQQHRAFYSNYTGFHDVMYGYKGQSLVVFDIPRDGVDDLHYATTEALKNKITFSRKYASVLSSAHSKNKEENFCTRCRLWHSSMTY